MSEGDLRSLAASFRQRAALCRMIGGGPGSPVRLPARWAALTFDQAAEELTQVLDDTPDDPTPAIGFMLPPRDEDDGGAAAAPLPCPVCPGQTQCGICVDVRG